MSEQSKILPTSLKQEFIFQNVILCHPHSILLLLKAKETGNNADDYSDTAKEYVVKIVCKEYYNSILHQILPTFSDSLFLLPQQIKSEQGKVFLIYPKATPIATYLQSQPFTILDIQNMVQDIGNAVILLHQNGWLHGDIAPGNIYITSDNHFILGDFSSSRPLSRRNRIKNKYTGATYTNSNIQKKPLLYQDIYSFSMMLYLFLHHGKHPNKKKLSSNTPIPKDRFPNCTSFLYESLSLSGKFQKAYPDFSTYLASLQSYLHMDAKTQKENSTILRFDPTISDAFEEQTRPLEKNTIPASSIIKYGFLIASTIFFFFCFSFSKISTPQHNIAKEKTYSSSIDTDNNKTTCIPYRNTSTPEFTPNHTSIPTNPPTPSPTNKAFAITPKPTIIYDISNSKYYDTDYLDEISSPNQTTILFADHNFFTKTSYFYSLNSLKELYLNHNQIKSISGISCLKSLRILDLSDNKLTDIRELSYLSQLHTLNLSYNHQISHFTALKSMKHLHTLIITNTNITKQQIKELKNSLPNLTIYY